MRMRFTKVARAMETITYQGRAIIVREVARPAGWSCRVLVADDGGAYLEYLVSVGPLKADHAALHRLRREDFAAFEAGDLDLGVLARNLADHDEAMGTFERGD
jgi:hypothetical protein